MTLACVTNVVSAQSGKQTKDNAPSAEAVESKDVLYQESIEIGDKTNDSGKARAVQPYYSCNVRVSCDSKGFTVEFINRY